jgi:hypothetical protein
VLPANELSERMASYYTVAWFDRYLKGDDSSFKRLTAMKFDKSADTDSIGAGLYDPQAALADPTDPTAGNVPYKIDGISIPNIVSFYYMSQYSLTDPRSGNRATCVDIRARCPATAPTTP